MKNECLKIKKKVDLKTIATEVLSVFSALGVATAGAAIYQDVKTADYADTSQIKYIASKLDCDMSYFRQLHGKYLMMEHNGNEPIYVYFDKSMNEEHKELAKESLDYVFDIVGEINNNYRYEIVDWSKYISHVGQTKIRYSIGDINYNGADVEGVAEAYPNLLSLLTNKRTANRFHISVSNSECDRADKLNTYIHELLHLFGFDDVHTLKAFETTNKYYGNTIMKSSHGNSGINLLTPNDMKVIMSVFTKKMSKKELDEKLNIWTSKLDDYENEYYKYFSERVLERSEASDRIEKGNYAYTGRYQLTELDGSVYKLNYEIRLKDDRYILKIFDKNNTMIDETNGDIFWNDGVAVLKNVELKKGITPGVEFETFEGGYISDLAMIADDGHFELYNVFTNGRIWFHSAELEEGLGI